MRPDCSKEKNVDLRVNKFYTQLLRYFTRPGRAHLGTHIDNTTAHTHTYTDKWLQAAKAKRSYSRKKRPIAPTRQMHTRETFTQISPLKKKKSKPERLLILFLHPLQGRSVFAIFLRCASNPNAPTGWKPSPEHAPRSGGKIGKWHISARFKVELEKHSKGRSKPGVCQWCGSTCGV